MKIANKYIVPVTPRGAGTSVSCGAIAVCGGIVLLMERMSYVALYRTWRPQDFEALVGQEHIKTALTNALESGKIAHETTYCRNNEYFAP